jgi:uncharacterized protein YdaU (DUF1376 family)
MERSPAFQFYPADFLSDPNVAGMSLQERGAYITLLCLCWKDGSLPLEDERLARMVGLPLPAWRKLSPIVVGCFTKADGRLVHKRLDHERQKQEEFRRRQSDKGKASAANRKATTVQPEANRGSTVVQPRPVQPDGNSSVFSLQTSVKSQSPSVPVSTRTEALTEAFGDRVRTFLEGYAVLYSLHRNGAHYHGRPAVDYQHACDLCTTWPDVERLLKLAAVFLTSDDEWISKGNRSVPQFSARASWCEDRLSEWEKAQGVA